MQLIATGHPFWRVRSVPGDLGPFTGTLALSETNPETAWLAWNAVRKTP